MIKTIIIIVLAVLAVISIYGALKFYRMYEEARARATENEWDLREVVSYVHHEGWAERPWGNITVVSKDEVKDRKTLQKLLWQGALGVIRGYPFYFFRSYNARKGQKEV